VIYLDSSAILKLVRVEDETAAMQAWLAARPDETTATSELGRVEVLRVARRIGSEALLEARAVLADLDLVPLGRTVQDLACDLGDPLLRTLDALHLASSLILGDALAFFVSYDVRLANAARSQSLTVVAPGQLSAP